MPNVWYPSCKVRLLVRFEDFLPTPSLPAPLIPGEPEAFGGSTFDALKFDIVPYDCSVTLNSYREADQASVTIPFKSLPFDPRILRAVGIQIFMGTIDPQAYADGMGALAGQAVQTLVPDSVDPTSPSAANEVFRGFVDAVEVNQDGDDTVTLECRDQTAIFLDAEVQQQAIAGLPRDLPLDLVISQILIGEATAQTLPQPPPLKWTAAQRQTVRGKRRQLTAALASVGAKLAKLNAAAAATQDPATIADITAKIVELTARQTELTSLQTAANISETTQEAIPLLAQRFGLPGARGTLVVNETRFNPMPTLAELKGVKYFDSKGTAKKSPTAGARQRINYWDLITDLCVASGFICYVRRPTEALPGGIIPPAELVITEPRTYYAEPPPLTISSAPNILAVQRAAEAQLNLREFAYGYNVNSLVVERNLTGKNAPQHIQVNARIAESGELVSARFPPTDVDPTGAVPFPANRAAPSQIGDRIEVQTLNYKGEIPEARAQEILALVAEKVYEEMSRGEFRVTIETRDLSFLPQNRGKRPAEADIFQLRAGDSIRIGTISNPTPEIEQGLASQAGIFAAMALPDRIEAFLALGLSPVAAIGAASAYENELFQDVYRVRTVGLNFNHNDGIAVQVEAVNYLDARNALSNVEGL